MIQTGSLNRNLLLLTSQKTTNESVQNVKYLHSFKGSIVCIISCKTPCRNLLLPFKTGRLQLRSVFICKKNKRIPYSTSRISATKHCYLFPEAANINLKSKKMNCLAGLNLHLKLKFEYFFAIKPFKNKKKTYI